MQRRPLDFRSFDEVIAELERLQQKGYCQGGKWGLGQACSHLAIFFRGSLDGFAGPRLPWYIRVLAPVFEWWMLRTRRMPAGVKIPAYLQPPAEVDETKAVTELRELIGRFQKHQGPLHQSPFAGSVRYDSWRELHLIHCAHHLSFLHPAEAP